MDSFTFYQDLPPIKLPIASLFHEARFSDVPADWHVIVSDIKNSTQAVSAGRYNDVNLVAAGSLIAALNVVKKYRTEVPFFFGGDGSTVLVPDRVHKEALAVLSAHNNNVSRNVGLQMHIGSLPVKKIPDSGHTLKLAKLEIDSVYSKAIAVGDGLRYAEQTIKQDQFDSSPLPLNTEPNLSGLECRWNKIQPPADDTGNVCYLIEAVASQKQTGVYADVFRIMEAIYGDLQQRHPLCLKQLKPTLRWQKFRKEMLIRFGKWKPAYFFSAFLKTFFGFFAFQYNWDVGGVKGKDYLAQLIAHADTFEVDGRINTIICGTPQQHRQFMQYLSGEEEKGALIYGHHFSRESIMTCYIENRNAKHIHFVDGADGGYTEASKEFKSKWKKQQVMP